ncbi:MAG: hypothetical protein LBT50_11965 [Prevotellaceae bacterium]|nr:hypothetical protein [Prevotellaceae bacterium]
MGLYEQRERERERERKREREIVYVAAGIYMNSKKHGLACYTRQSTG